MLDPRVILGPADLTAAERERIFEVASRLKSQPNTAPVPSGLRVGALYFNPSLRTRASFEQAAWLVGGTCQTLNAGADTWGLELDPEAVMDGDKVENVAEAARVLGQFFHVLGVRSFRGDGSWEVERTEPVLRRFAQYSNAPIVSLEGTTHHPCQALADHLTMRERLGEDLSGQPVVLRWAWHPRMLPAAVPHSYLLESALAGCDVRVLHPEGYDLDAEILEQARTAARAGGGDVRVSHDPRDVAGARVLYVKSWGPLGQTGPNPDDLRADWQVDMDLVGRTEEAGVMHCLPVRRNVVISGDVLESPHSWVTQQAGNRMWAQAGLLSLLGTKVGVL